MVYPRLRPRHTTFNEDTPGTRTLVGTDPDGDTVTFALATTSEYGELLFLNPGKGRCDLGRRKSAGLKRLGASSSRMMSDHPCVVPVKSLLWMWNQVSSNISQDNTSAALTHYGRRKRR